MTARGWRKQILTNQCQDGDFDDDAEDEDDEDDADDADDDDEDDDEEEETWQVVAAQQFPLKGGSSLTSGIDLPRLAEIFQPS